MAEHMVDRVKLADFQKIKDVIMQLSGLLAAVH
jgi:hypothetical protein